MLVLSRRENEVVSIDNGRIRVMVVGLHDNRVRLGFIADKKVPIHRAEVQIEVDQKKIKELQQQVESADRGVA